MTDEAPALNAEAIIAVLNAHGVDHVVIGAFAAQASGAPIPPTLDIDFTPSSSPENVRRIADALRELGARLRVVGAIDVPTLKAEQARIDAAKDRLADLDANLGEQQEILELAASLAARCGDAYRKANDRTRSCSTPPCSNTWM